MSKKEKLFLLTSESVAGGYLDKLCDHINEAVLSFISNAHLRTGPDAKVAYEQMFADQMDS